LPARFVDAAGLHREARDIAAFLYGG